MSAYECTICEKIISDKELYNNDGVCNECLLVDTHKTRITYQGLNNIDEILEKGRNR